MVDFKKLLKMPPRKRYDYHYECVTCHEKMVFVIEMPAHLKRHGFTRRDKCRGRLRFIEKVECRDGGEEKR